MVAETTILGAGGLRAAPRWSVGEPIVPGCRRGEEQRGSPMVRCSVLDDNGCKEDFDSLITAAQPKVGVDG